jgi:prephenate dehydrogenase
VTQRTTGVPTEPRDPTRTPPFASVAIIGLGLMGGSLARALRRAPNPPRIVGFSPDPAEVDEALRSGVLDAAVDDAESAAAAGELVVYAAPLSAILDLQTRHHSVWLPGAVASDLSSLKVPVASQARALGIEARWVGAHPMVGGERSGFAASRDALFREAAVWLSSAGAPAAVCARVERFWAALGARPAWIDASAHDARMVHASHLPQVVANLLARHLENHGVARAELGPGGRDMTRLAASSPRVWRDLLEHSAPDLAIALRELGAELEALVELLDARDVGPVAELMRRTRSWASASERATPGGGTPS